VDGLVVDVEQGKLLAEITFQADQLPVLLRPTL
jgi:hypothetical protein